MKPATRKLAAAEQRVEYEAWYEEQVRLGLDDLNTGRVISHEEVVKRGQEQITRLKLQHAKAA